MNKMVLIISFLFVYFLIPEIFGQSSVQEAQQDLAYLTSVTASEKNIFYTELVGLLANLEEKNCGLNEGEKEGVRERMTRIIFRNSGASPNKKAAIIMRALQDDLDRKNCNIDPNDPAIRQFLQRAEDLIKRVHTLAGALHDDVDS